VLLASAVLLAVLLAGESSRAMLASARFLFIVSYLYFAHMMVQSTVMRVSVCLSACLSARLGLLSQNSHGRICRLLPVLRMASCFHMGFHCVMCIAKLREHVNSRISCIIPTRLNFAQW